MCHASSISRPTQPPNPPLRTSKIVVHLVVAVLPAPIYPQHFLHPRSVEKRAKPVVVVAEATHTRESNIIHIHAWVIVHHLAVSGRLQEELTRELW